MTAVDDGRETPLVEETLEPEATIVEFARRRDVHPIRPIPR
jgi:hypothetical protein